MQQAPAAICAHGSAPLPAGTGGPQRTGVYVQFKIQALPHYPLPPEKPSTASEERCCAVQSGDSPLTELAFALLVAAVAGGVVTVLAPRRCRLVSV